MDTITTARQMRLAVIRDFVANGGITEEEARAVLAGPLEPGNLATVVDDSSLLNDPNAYALIANPPDPPVLLLRSQIFLIIQAVRSAFSVLGRPDGGGERLRAAEILTLLEPLVKHEHAPAEFDGDGRFLCSICGDWVHKYEWEE